MYRNWEPVAYPFGWKRLVFLFFVLRAWPASQSVPGLRARECNFAYVEHPQDMSFILYVSLRIRGVHTTIKHSTRKVPGPFGKIRCVKTYALSGSKCNLLEFSFALSRESCSNSSPTPMSPAASSSKIIIASQSKFKQNLCVTFGSFAGPH